jgi:hypothetical protein
MTQITLGRFNAYSTSYGCYDAYFQYDTATRDGTTITLTNCKVYYVRVGTGYTTNRIATTGSIGGGQNAWSNVTLNPSGTQSPATMTHTLGTKTITGVDYAVSTISVNVQAKGTGASSTWTATSGTVQLNATINVTVPTILISEVTATNANIGSASSININRYSSVFTHKLYYKFTGQASYTLIASDITTSYGWTVPTSAYALIPNALTIGCTIKCETYNGASYIGESTTTMTASVDQNTNKPDVSGAITDTNAVSTALTGDSSKIVKYISNARTVITSTAKNSATISSVKVTCADGKSSTLATSTLNAVESGTFTVEATDSRGIKNSVVYNKTLINYIKLTLNVNVYRTQPTNNEIACTFNGNYFNGSFGAESNTLNVKWRYREVGGSYGSYSNFTETIVGNAYSNGSSEIVLGTSFDYTKSYQFEFIANDKIYTASEIISTKTVTQGLPNYHWDADSFTHETEIISNSSFNQGTWNAPIKGALTQVVDDTSAQHSVIVGRRKDTGARLYGLDFLDNYTTPIMRIYAGSRYLVLDSDGLKQNGTLLLKETDVVDNLTSTSAIAPLSAKQGKALNDALSPNATWTLNKSSSGSGWYKAVKIDKTESTFTVEITGYSSVSSISTRGHFKLILSAGSNNAYAHIIYATNGLSASSFDYRYTSSNSYVFYFYIPQYTPYTMSIKTVAGAIPTFTTYNVAETPAGTVAPVG